MNGQRPARRLIPEGSLSWDPETGVLLSSDEEIARALSGGKVIRDKPEPRPPSSPRANNAPGLYGPRRVERFNGGLAVIGEGEVIPVDSRSDAREILEEPASAAALGHAPSLSDSPSRRDAASDQELLEGLILSPERGRREGACLGPDKPEADSLPLLVGVR